MSEALLRVSNMSRKTRSNRQTELSFDLAAAPGADELSPHTGGEGRTLLFQERAQLFFTCSCRQGVKEKKYEIQDRDTNRNFFFWPCWACSACPAFQLVSKWGQITSWPQGLDDLSSAVPSLHGAHGVHPDSPSTETVSLWGAQQQYPWLATGIMAELLGAVTTATKFFFEVGTSVILCIATLCERPGEPDLDRQLDVQVVLQGDHHHPPRLQPPLRHKTVLRGTNQLWCGESTAVTKLISESDLVMLVWQWVYFLAWWWGGRRSVEQLLLDVFLLQDSSWF